MAALRKQSSMVSPESQAKAETHAEWSARMAKLAADNLNKKSGKQPAPKKPVVSQKRSIAELKAMSPKQRGEYLASLMVQALRENTKDLPERKAGKK